MTSTGRKAWTRSEEIEVCTLRWLRFKQSVIARRMGRSQNSVHMRLYELGMCKRMRYSRSEYREAIERYNRKGWSDARIARTLGLFPANISRARRRMGLPCNMTPQDACRLAGIASGKSRRTVDSRGHEYPRCWACNLRGPNGHALRKYGWVCRPLAGQECTTEVYCPTCFAEHGWGDITTNQEGI